MSAWETEQFVRADDPSAHDNQKSLAQVLNDYLAIADRILGKVVCGIKVESGPAPIYELRVQGMNRAATRVLSSWPSHEAVALWLHAQCVAVAGLVDQGNSEAAALCAMRLERTYLQFEHALRFEPKLRAVRKQRASLFAARAKSAERRKKITPASYLKAKQSARTRKELASLLGVSSHTLKKFERSGAH